MGYVWWLVLLMHMVFMISTAQAAMPIKRMEWLIYFLVRWIRMAFFGFHRLLYDILVTTIIIIIIIISYYYPITTPHFYIQ
ncbi:hypothetical protein BCR42DRAFT_427830 [Absidia repens]|uniref:YggT family protein n=1 Tax=Absidia repens TaxID=90262 RepID=A0A1X2HZ45_9FUNG|nr:hypothetical protein BCR42DRAFT_427830 [Absidia repens]